LRLQAQRRSASPESTVPVTVPRSVSRSRRWRCAHPHNPSTASTERVAHIYDRSHNTPATSANSAERTLSSARLSVFGTADRAARPPLEVPTLSRKAPPHLIARKRSQRRFEHVQQSWSNTNKYPELPLLPPQGQRSVVSARLLRFKGKLGTGVEFFEHFLCIGSHDQ
jgi:hypothetical protein